MDSEIKKKGRPKGSKNISYTDNKTIGVRLDPKTLDIITGIAVNNHSTLNKVIASIVRQYIEEHSS